MINTLYGDGIHDDWPAIQELLDSGVNDVALPAPDACYQISKTLTIHSNQALRLTPQTTIRLMPQSNCFMLKNERDAHDIVIEGGIWDFNNMQQAPNPFKRGTVAPGPSHWDADKDTVVRYSENIYLGVGMRFLGVKRFTIRNLTMKDPVTFCMQLSEAEYFTVENIRFDMNYGNPIPLNMDGVHVDGGCRFGNIRNVQGTCYDDIVALNADDFNDGPIEDISIDGVYGKSALRGVRLLSTHSPVRRISIANVFGTYYQNGVLISYFYPRTGVRGVYDHIVLRNIFASNAPRLPIFRKPPKYEFSMINIDSDLDIGTINIDCAHRDEECGDIEMLSVGKNTDIRSLSVSHMSQNNMTGRHFPLIRNDGHIQNLYLLNVQSGEDERFQNNGAVDKLIDLDA